LTMGLLDVDMSTDIKDIPLRFASPGRPATIPAWAKSWRAGRTTMKELFSASLAPGVVVIQSQNREELESALKKLSSDAGRPAAGTAYIQVVVQMGATPKVMVEDVTRVLKYFPSPAGRIGFAWGRDNLQRSVIEAAAKLMVEQEEAAAQRPDPLAEAREVIAATRPLLAASGRLSAPAIAEFFDISTAKLGQIIGSSRQALAKTPDAPAIQSALRPFERIARLRALLPAEDFLAWLHRPNRLLGEAPPLGLIEDGRVNIVADLAEDMLLGTPG
jgi:hypothetical protein